MILVCLVEGGQRAIIFNRIGGMQMDTVQAEGLHFRYDCASIKTYIHPHTGIKSVIYLPAIKNITVE